ncbi:MAG: dihydroneopterin aldolase [Schwartzia sp. (in: firmicutes)]
MDRIKLEGMEFSGCHGCLPVEKEVAQRFLVDVSLSFSRLTAGEADDAAATVDYAAVFTAVQEIVEGPTVSLIETLGERIVDAIFTQFSMVEKVRVAVHKPQAPLPGKFQDVSVILVRQRP